MIIVNMQLCKSPSEINKAIASNCNISKSSSCKEGWEGLYSAEQIISIVYIPNIGEYSVFWREEVRRLPTTQPEIIRCKDCLYGLKGIPYRCRLAHDTDSENWYCADAKKRET